MRIEKSGGKWTVSRNGVPSEPKKVVAPTVEVAVEAEAPTVEVAVEAEAPTVEVAVKEFKRKK